MFITNTYYFIFQYLKYLIFVSIYIVYKINQYVNQINYNYLKNDYIMRL